jgi:peptidase E
MASNRAAGHIVAMGGGGFSMESASYIVNFYRAFSGRAIPTDVTLFESPLLKRRPAHTSDLAAFVAEQDVIYVGGGSTANLLAVWRARCLR